MNRTAALAAASLLSLGLSSPPQAEAAQARLNAVRTWSQGTVTRVAIETSQAVEYRSERVEGPHRIFFDLQDARRLPGRRGIETVEVRRSRLLRQIRIAQTEPGVVRIVLDLEQPAEYTVSQLGNPHRLIVELRPAGALPASPVPAPAPEVTAAPTPPPPGSEAAARRVTARPVAAAPVTARRATRPFVPPPVPEHWLPEPPRFGYSVLSASARRRKAPLFAKPFPPAPFRAPAESPSKPPTQVAQAPALPPSGPQERAIPGIPAVERAAPPAPAVATAETRIPGTVRTQPAPTPAPVQPAASRAEMATAAQRNSQGERSLIRALGLKLQRVVLDPGHGGHDHGTTGPAGLAEKELVLDVAKRLGALIEQRLGSEVVYTRTDDTFIPLEARTALAMEKGADLFLSIHANSSRLKNTAGPETFYLNFTTDEDAMDVAARENATSTSSIRDYPGLLQKIALNEKVQESREFAAAMQSALYGGLARSRGLRNRGVKKAPFVVLIGAQIPSVLTEVAFLSNPKEEAQLKKSEYRQRIAESLFKGVSQYAASLSHYQVARQETPAAAVPAETANGTAVHTVSSPLP